MLTALKALTAVTSSEAFPSLNTLQEAQPIFDNGFNDSDLLELEPKESLKL